jgi:hypothetical protein
MEFGFGSGVLTGIRTDSGGTLTPIRFGALQNVDIEFSGDTKELFATNQYPIDTARGKTKITGKAKVAEIKARMFNDLFFGQILSTTTSLKYSWNESSALGGTGAASYTVANAGSTPLLDQGVFLGSNGNQLIAVSSAPTAGQYVFNASTGAYTFGTLPAGTGVLVNYSYTVTGGNSIALGNPLMGNTPRFKATFFQEFENNQVVLVLNACVSNRLTFPTRIDDYVIEDLDFSAFADASGSVGSWNSTN